jgi:uroporphyrinogen III methyltransferase / synthase
VIERGTLPGQRVLEGTLQTIASLAESAGVRAPAVALFGNVASLRSRLDWLESRPLAGRTVAVTRARAQASGLAARLRELGAVVVEAPTIKIVALDPDLPLAVDGYDLVCVTSPNGARALWRARAWRRSGQGRRRRCASTG